jgi:hypothetical protein
MRTPLLIDILYILTGLAIMIGSIALLGALGFGVGLDVFPMGEDNTWIDILQRGKGADAARLFWAIDNRNPLSPWWYIATRTIILNFDTGLLALRYAMSAILALSAYCMVLTVAGRQSRPFALGLGLLIVFWLVNRFSEQVFWNFQGALACSLLSISAYAQFIRGGRRSYRLYALSIILWFIAFATYTLQSGAMLAIAYLALRHGSVERFSDRNWIIKRAYTAVVDAAPYLALWVLFFLLWQTTIHPLAAQSLSLHFRLPALLTSLREGAWTTEFVIFYSRLINSPNIAAFISAAAGCCVLTFVALHWRRRFPGTPSSVIAVPQLIDVFIVVACIASPTVALESSSLEWGPGTRWPMIYQFTAPAILLTLVALVLITTTLPGQWRYRLWTAAVSIAVGVGALFSLTHNQSQVDISRTEKFVRDSLLRLISEDLVLGHEPPLQILIMLDKVSRYRWRSADSLSPIISRVWLQRDDISFRLVPWSSPPSSTWAGWWPIRFGSDSDGVGNAKVWGGSVPYDKVRILEIDGPTARRISRADRHEFDGWFVEWHRDGPITLPGVGPMQICPMVWSADQDVLSLGWGERERDEKGPLRWTTSLSSRVALPSGCPNRSVLRLVVGYAASMRNIENLNLYANGHKLQYHRKLADGNFVYETELSPALVSERPVLNIDLVVHSLHTVPGATRPLGVAVRRIEIVPTDSDVSAPDPSVEDRAAR